MIFMGKTTKFRWLENQVLPSILLQILRQILAASERPMWIQQLPKEALAWHAGPSGTASVGRASHEDFCLES